MLVKNAGPTTSPVIGTTVEQMVRNNKTPKHNPQSIPVAIPQAHVNAVKTWPSAVFATAVAALRYYLGQNLPPQGHIIEIEPCSENIANVLQQHGLVVESINVNVLQSAKNNKGSKDSVTKIDKKTGNNISNNCIENSCPSKWEHYFEVAYTVNIIDKITQVQLFVPQLLHLLVPDGVFMNIVTSIVPTDISNHMTVGWETILKRNQVVSAFKFVKDPAVQLAELLQEAGTMREKKVICRWVEPYTPRDRLNSLTALAHRGPLPVEIYMRCVRDYERWLKAQYSDLDAKLECSYENSLQLWRIEASSSKKKFINE